MSLSFPNPQFQTLCDSHTPVSRMFQSIFLPFLAEIKVICQSTPQSPTSDASWPFPDCGVGFATERIRRSHIGKRPLLAYRRSRSAFLPNPHSRIPDPQPFQCSQYSQFTSRLLPSGSTFRSAQRASLSRHGQGGVRIILSLSYPEMSLRPPCAHLAANQYV